MMGRAGERDVQRPRLRDREEVCVMGGGRVFLGVACRERACVCGLSASIGRASDSVLRNCLHRPRFCVMNEKTGGSNAADKTERRRPDGGDRPPPPGRREPTSERALLILSHSSYVIIIQQEKQNTKITPPPPS